MQSVIKIIAITFMLTIVMCRLNIANAQVVITTVAVPPVNPYLNQALNATGNGIHVSIIATQENTVYFYGSLRRLSPAAFSIGLNPSFTPTGIKFSQGETRFLDNETLKLAFANFEEGDLALSNISLDDLKEGPNYKLPEGLYEICFSAKIDPNGPIISTGCDRFNICRITTPQFTQPVNSLITNPSITIVPPTTPVIFSWVPPQSSCGLPVSMFNYNFELREILDEQTITDALNNPYVFRKAGLTTSIFSLDTNLYQHVLQEGKKYIMQVQAKAIDNLRGTVENNGFSRVEAFQYGESGSSNDGQHGRWSPGDYHIASFEERKTAIWDSLRLAGKDTLIPIKEYIAFALMEEGIAYNVDAIELLLSTNPELVNQKAVKLSYVTTFPDFPEISAAKKERFDAGRSRDLAPDSTQLIKFNQYLNELSDLRQRLPSNAVEPVNAFLNYLNMLKGQVSDYSGVLLGYINELLSELLYNARSYSTTLNDADFNELQSLIAAVKDLSSVPASDNGFLPSSPLKSTLQVSTKGAMHYLFHNAGYINPANNTIYHQVAEVEDYFQGKDQLLTFNIIVWSKLKDQSRKATTIVPEVREVYRISYILSALYNHKNPEIGSHSSNDLASTIQCLLPGNAKFKFWTQNVLTRKSTTPEDVDLKDIYINSMKEGSSSKKLSVVLKVE
jgi:hypothetical protein